MSKEINIEEAIKIIERQIHQENGKQYNYIDIDNSIENECEEFITAIEILLADRQRQLEINEEHQKLNGELREEIKDITQKYNNLKSYNKGTKEALRVSEELEKHYSIEASELEVQLNNSISKDVIKEKIEELWIKCPKNSINDFMINERNNKIEVLKELL